MSTKTIPQSDPPTPYGGPCGWYVDPSAGEPCMAAATVPATYRRKVDGFVLHTHDCPEHVGCCNDRWEYVKEASAA